MCLRPNHSPNAGWSYNDGAVNICLIRLQEWNIIYHVFFLRFGTADRLGKWSFMFFSHALQQVRKIIFRVFFSRFATAATYGKWSLIFFFLFHAFLPLSGMKIDLPRFLFTFLLQPWSLGKSRAGKYHFAQLATVFMSNWFFPSHFVYLSVTLHLYHRSLRCYTTHSLVIGNGVCIHIRVH